jgi:hypothetical protein
MMKTKFIWVIVLSLLMAGAAFAQARGPAETVKAFYKYSDARSDIFDKRHIESRRQWYTLALYRTFRALLAKDTAYLKKNPTDKPFFGDGLTFRPLDETCEANGKHYGYTQTVGRASIIKDRATVNVKSAFPKACGNLEPERYRINLRKIGNRWLIDDMDYLQGETLKGEMKKYQSGSGSTK